MEKGDDPRGPDPRGPDPHLEIRGPRSSRPLDKWRGGGVSKKTFSALRATVWSKNRGSRALRAPDPRLLQLITIETLSNGNQPRRVSSFT